MIAPIETVEATEVFTATTTDASTETLLFTETTTVTADTYTVTITDTETEAVTSTDVQTASTTVTSTSWSYQYGSSSLKARGTALATAVPSYASDACSWDQYVGACKCAGVTATTITLAAETETITLPADSVTTIATVSLTSTETVSVTATVSATELATVALTETATTTSTATLTSTAVISQTTTPTVVAPRTCKPVDLPFRATSVFSDSTTRYLDMFSSLDGCGWQTFPGAVFGTTAAYRSMWRLDSNGYIEMAYPVGTDTTVRAPYIDLTTATKESVAPAMKLIADVQAGVAAGKLERLRGCVDADTNMLYLTAAGRSNVYSCGNTLYLSSGAGTDAPWACVSVAATAAFS